jgi:hypothetical protein
MPYLTPMKYYIMNFPINDPTLIYSSDDDSEDENPPLASHLPLIGSIEHEPTPTPQLLRWVHTT